MSPLYGDTSRSTRALCFRLLNSLGVTNNNVCISPLSIGLALQLALSGASGNTLQELLQTLQVRCDGRDALAKDCKELMRSLTKFDSHDSKVELAIANSMWAHNDVVLHPGFVAHLIENYSAEARSLDFGSPGSVEIVNAWVNAKTYGKIPSLLDQLRPDQILVLINCAYFKAKWLDQFEPHRTQMKDFYVPNSAPVQVPMMNMPCRLAYFNDNSIEVVELPYRDRRFAMYIVLPARGASLANFVAGVTTEHWERWRSSLSDHQGEFSMPRFTFQYREGLAQQLLRLGIREAFSPEADFWNMLSPESPKLPLFKIGEVIHQTFISVDEQGTEAAAATAVMMFGGGFPPPLPPFKMIVDRPFLFIMADTMTDTILFAGTVFDPR